MFVYIGAIYRYMCVHACAYLYIYIYIYTHR